MRFTPCAGGLASPYPEGSRTMARAVARTPAPAAAPRSRGPARAPDSSRVPGKEVTPLPATPAPAAAPPIGAAEAMPAPAPEADVSLQQSKRDADKSLADAKVTPQQLRKANDPRFSAVLTAKAAVD